MTPAIKNKMDPSASLLYCKCKTGTGDLIHCFWSCLKIQSCWSSVVDELSFIFNVPIELAPVCLLLGFPNCHITRFSHKRLLNWLTFAARKNILFYWIKEASPSKNSWHNIITDCIPNEYITSMLHSRMDSFHKMWGLYLDFIGPRLSSSVLQGFHHCT